MTKYNIISKWYNEDYEDYQEFLYNDPFTGKVFEEPKPMAEKVCFMLTCQNEDSRQSYYVKPAKITQNN